MKCGGLKVGQNRFALPEQLRNRKTITLHTVNIRPLEEKTGKDIKKIREKFGLSQGALAEIVGVSRKTVESWEHGGVSSKPVARILQLIEADPRIMDFLVEEKHKDVSGR
jgi:putative transcriptional regulator